MICPECKGERSVYRCFQNRITLTPCPMCNGVGEVVYTNFDRITASPEKLAEFLATWFVLPCELCEHFRHAKCTEKISERHCDEAEAFE